jgi:hypothetical protein
LGERASSTYTVTLRDGLSHQSGMRFAVTRDVTAPVAYVQAPPTHFSGLFDVSWNAQDPSANGSKGPSSLLRIDSLHTTQSGTVAGF